MTNDQRNRRRKRLVIITFLAVVAIAAAIFLFSSESGEQSNDTSSRFAVLYLRVFHPGYDALPDAERAVLMKNAQFAVRKTAHFLEYAALGLFLRLFLYGIRLPHPPAFVLTLLLGAGYAALDEYHQKLVGTRTAMWQDAVLDSAGVLFGLLMATLIVIRRVRKKRCAGQG